MNQNRENPQKVHITRVLQAVLALILAIPELPEIVLKNRTRRWSRGIFHILFPLIKFVFAVALFLGTAYASLEILKVLIQKITACVDQLVHQIAGVSFNQANTRVGFVMLLLKCIAGGFLAGSICRAFAARHEKHTSRISLLRLLSGGIGLYALAKDQTYFCQLAATLSKIPTKKSLKYIGTNIFTKNSLIELLRQDLNL